ncbi:hypothetical protein, partial [Kribbella aluminosa]|uniref:hypothetical protein n=1 Tax=Kribbella aluminosa TaxID=416017 RepID=UPI0031DEE811
MGRKLSPGRRERRVPGAGRGGTGSGARRYRERGAAVPSAGCRERGAAVPGAGRGGAECRVPGAGRGGAECRVPGAGR